MSKKLIDADWLHKELEIRAKGMQFDNYKILYDLIDSAPPIKIWHYPSHHDFPSTSRDVVIKRKYVPHNRIDYVIGHYFRPNWFVYEDEGNHHFGCDYKVVAWREI